MEESFIYQIDPFWQVTILFVLMLLAVYLGDKIGDWTKKQKGSVADGNSATLIGALFALAAFLLAFTFSMSANRFDTRREIIVQEANNIGTAVLRADLYPDSIRQEFRSEFKKYIEARIAFFDAGINMDEIIAALKSSDASSSKIWHLATKQSKIPSNLVASNQMIPALNAMIDIVTTRSIALVSKVPPTIIIMLFLLSITCAFFAGYIGSEKKIDWLISTGFCFLTVLVIYITLDLDRPRRGFIQLNTSHQAMYDLRNMFKEK
jgi:hypothetical protein